MALADDVAPGAPLQACSFRIDLQDAEVAVEQYEAFSHAVEDAAGAHLALAQRRINPMSLGHVGSVVQEGLDCTFII